MSSSSSSSSSSSFAAQASYASFMNDPQNGGDASAWVQENCGCCGELFANKTAVRAHMAVCNAIPKNMRAQASGEASDDDDDALSPAQRLANEIHTEIDKHWSGESLTVNGQLSRPERSGLEKKYKELHIRLKAARAQPLTVGQRHELWVAHFCLKNALGRESAQEMTDWWNDGQHDKVNRAATYRTVLKKISRERGYPDVAGYSFNRSISIDVPAGFNGAAACQVTMKCANIMDVVASMLNDRRLHGGKPENIHWDPKLVQTKSKNGVPSERAYDSDIASGQWFHRTSLKLGADKKMVVVNIFSDGTNVTGSGSQSAHPVYVQIGNFVEEVRNKEGS